MLDRKGIKADVKGILGNESRGSVFLATLLVFAIVLVYFGCTYVIGQFFPVTGNELNNLASYSSTQLLPEFQTLADSGKLEIHDFNGLSDAVSQISSITATALRTIGASGLLGGFRNFFLINLLAFVLELFLLYPLTLGTQKFMLRLTNLKEPGPGVILRCYGKSFIFRSFLLPLWKDICIIGWQIIMHILLMGIFAGIALATNVGGSEIFSLLSNGNLMSITQEQINQIVTYFTTNGWMYGVGFGVWCLIYIWLMIFKNIAYSLSSMILAWRPVMGVRKALRASRRLTRKHHFAMFKVSLSFIGWYLLATLALLLVASVGIGMDMLKMGQLGMIITLALLVIVVILIMYLLMPYRIGVHAKCFCVLKENAEDRGVVDRYDFLSKRQIKEMEE